MNAVPRVCCDAGPGKTVLGLALAAAFCAPLAIGAPQGGQVTSGVATIVKGGAVTRIDQSTQKAAINWQSFSLGSGETIRFNQPNASAITLNRIVGNEASVIDGALNANGKVFLINSNGVIFGRSSRVSTAGLVASTLSLRDVDFLAGRYVFKGDAGSGSVVNEGTLAASDGGYVVLLGRSVSNQGVIVASKGTVSLNGGQKISLDFGGDSLLSVSIDEGALAALVENKGAVMADGGKVILTAKAADDLLGSQVNNSGILQARTLDDLKGHIVASAEGGTATIGGTLDASAPGAGDGGRIETSGRHVEIADSTLITTRAAHGHTGTWIVDPDGFTIGPGGDISGAALGTQLGQNNVTLASTQGSGADGSIQVNEAVSWAAETLLTLNATGDIHINAPITATGAHAGLAMNYGGFASTGSAAAGSDYHIDNITTGSDGSLTIGPASVTLGGAQATLSINGESYTLIHSMAQLAAISPAVLDSGGHQIIDPDTGYLAFTPAAGHYALARNLDATGITYPFAVVKTLEGTLAGLGHSIGNLSISTTTPNAASQFEDAALIGTLGSDINSRLRDLGLVNASIAGGALAAGLVGFSNGSISNVYVTGTIAGVQPVGGIAGYNLGSIVDAHADVAISAMAGGNFVGGLAGFNGNDASISNATVKGSIRAAGLELGDGGLQTSSSIGGLIGLNGGTIDNAHTYASVTTTDSSFVGGLVGENFNGAGDNTHAVISHSSASGTLDVTWINTQGNGQSYGGLVGDNNGGFIKQSSANVNLTATATTVDANGVPWSINGVGGLVGTNATSFGTGGIVSDSSSSGAVKGAGATYQVGGAVGSNLDGGLTSVRATGNVSTGGSGQDIGGLVGSNGAGGTVQDSGATGSVKRPSTTSGDPLVGSNSGSIVNSSYHDAAAEAAAAAAAQAAADAAAKAAAARAAADAAAAQAAADAAAAKAAADKAAADAAAAALARLHQRADAAASIAAVAMADAQRATASPPSKRPSEAVANGKRRAALDANIVIRERNFEANVRSIEVNGQVFQLDDEKPTQQPPASP